MIKIFCQLKATYTRITEGKIYTSDGSEDTHIQDGFVVTRSVQTNSIGSRTVQRIEINGGDNCTVLARTSSGNGYFYPSDNRLIRCGTTSYFWNIVYIKGGVSTTSDKNAKENIQYLNRDYTRVLASSMINNEEMLDFINNEPMSILKKVEV
ncbi:MAG: hypothetical protein AB2402_15090 [Terrisporobacter glycolicus]